MKIAFALMENHHRSCVDEHFGRCDWYCIYDTKSKKSKYIENPNRYAEEGAGCTSAELLIEQGVETTVAGRFGSKVVEIFKKNNIQMIVPDDKNKTMEDLIKSIKN